MRLAVKGLALKQLSLFGDFPLGNELNCLLFSVMLYINKKMAEDKNPEKNDDNNEDAKKKTAFEELVEKYSSVGRYQEIGENYLNEDNKVHDKIPTSDLVRIVDTEMKKVGLKDDDRQYHLAYMVQVDRDEVFTNFVGLGQKRAIEGYQGYAKENMEDIVNSTDDEILTGVFLPEAVKNKTGNPEYDGLGKLVNEVQERTKNLKKLRDNEGDKELVAKLSEDLKTHYKATYDDKEDEDLLKVLNGMADGVSILKYKIEYDKIKKELDEQLDGKLKDYVMTLDIDKLVDIYTSLLEQSRQAQKQGYINRAKDA